MAVSFATLRIGDSYTRQQLADAWGYAGIEAISRGVVTPRDDKKIILFVTREKRSCDTQYRNDFVGNVLLWEGPEKHGAEDRIIAHVENGDEIHVFYRDEHVEPFTYIGPMTLYCAQRMTDRPSRFVFQASAVMGASAA